MRRSWRDELEARLMSLYYSDDSVELYHGDCREITKWLECDVLVTDPPYGIEWMGNTFDSDRSKRDDVRDRRKAQGGDIANDHDTAARDDVLALWGNGGAAIVFGTWRKDRPANTQHRLIWHKMGRFPGVNPHPWFPNDEEIYLLGKGWVGKPHPSVISTQESRSSHVKAIGHPTPKPVGLMETLINKCPPGSIADPFAGSGSTLIAARNSGRKAIGVELDERYCEIIANRLSQDVLI
jgi:site-specific DNA-methyltransferase (adenine-specific)